MTATEEVEEIKKRKVLDTPGLKLLIAKVKKGDADNADAIEAKAGKDEVLKIAPPSAVGTGEVMFYRGNLV